MEYNLPDFETKVVIYTSTVAVLFYNLMCLIRELCNMKDQKWHYIVDPSNFVSWTLYISSTLTVLPSLYPMYENIQVRKISYKKY